MNNKTLLINPTKREGEEYTYEITNGITKRLLEKYKPNRNFSQIDDLNQRRLENRAA